MALALTARAAAAGGEPKHDFKPADQALARSLWKDDLPPRGFAIGDAPSDPEPLARGPHCNGKPDESDLTLTGKFISPFIYGPTGISPTFYLGASVFSSEGQAQTAFQRETQATLARCLIQTTISDWAKGFLSFKVVLVSESLKPLSGFAGQAAAVRLLFRLTQTTKPALFAEDLIVLRRGRTEAWFAVTVAFHLQPRFVLEKQLLASVAARMP